MSTSSPRLSGKCARRAGGAASATRRAISGVFAAAAVVALAGCGAGGGGAVIDPGPEPRAWSAPARLAQDAPALSLRPAAAISAAGSATVFWSQTGLVPPGGTTRSTTPLMAAAENTGATRTAAWGASAAVESEPPGARATDPIDELSALSPATGAVAVWRRGTAPGDRLRSVRRLAVDWEALDIRAVPASATASGLVAAANDAGLQAAAWIELIGGVPQVHLSVRNLGAVVPVWSSPMTVQTAPSLLRIGSSPAIAVGDNGLVMIVWRQSAPGLPIGPIGFVWSRIYNPLTLQFSAESRLDPLNSLDDMRNPKVAALAAGQFVATWEQQNLATTYDLRSAIWSGLAWLRPSAPVGAPAVSDTQLAAGPGQTALAVWRQDGTLYLNELAAGMWGLSPRQVGANLSGTSLEPRIGVDAMGNAIIVWAQRPSSSTVSDLYYATFSSATSRVSNAALLARDALTGDVAAPTLAVGANGSAVVAWPQAVAGQQNPDLLARIFRP